MYLYIHNMHRSSNKLTQRLLLDRRRLEEAHFQYALLMVASWYPDHFKLSDLHLHGATQDTLLYVTGVYHRVFMKKYSGEL